MGQELEQRVPADVQPLMGQGVRTHYGSRKRAPLGPYSRELPAVYGVASNPTSTLRSEVGWAAPVTEDTWRTIDGQARRVLGFMVLLRVTTWEKASLNLYVTNINHFFTFLGFVMVSRIL